MKRLFICSLFLLAACQTAVQPDSTARSTPPAAPAGATPDDPCAAEKFQHLVGTSGDEIKDDMFPVGSRVLRPGMVMTMDYRSERLNVVIGEENTVERIYCG